MPSLTCGPPMEVELIVSSARISAASLAASCILTAVAAIACVTDAQAAQQQKAAFVQRAPVAAARVVAPRPTPQAHITSQVHINVSKPVRLTPTTTSTFSHQQSFDKFHKKTNIPSANPAVQLNNPNLSFKPSPQSFKPNL